MADSRTKNSVKNISSGLLSRLLTLLISFGSRTVFIYVLGEECLGLNGLFTTLLSLFSVAELGIGHAITFYMYKPIAECDNKRLSQLIKFYRLCYKIIGMAIAVIGVAIIPLLPYIITLENDVGYDTTLLYLLYLANTVVTYMFFSYPQTVLAANQKQYITTNCNLVFSVIIFVAEGVALFMTHNYIIYLCVRLLLGIVQNFCIAIIAFRKYPYLKTKHADNIPMSEIKEMFKDVFSIFVVKLSSQLFTSTDNIFISVMFGTVLVGYNSNYVMIISAISGIVSICIYSCTGSVGNLIAASTKEVIYSRFKTLDYLNFCISAFCAVCLYELLNPFISLIWSSKMLFSEFAVALMCLNFFLVSSLSTLFMFREAMGLFRYYIYNQLFAAVTNMVLNVVLGGIFGIEGIFSATVIANCCFAIIPFIKNLYSIGFSMPYKEYLYLLVSRLCFVIGISAILHFLCRNIPNTLGWFALRAVIVISITGLSIILTGLQDNQFKTILNYVKSLFQKRG